MVEGAVLCYLAADGSGFHDDGPRSCSKEHVGQGTQINGRWEKAIERIPHYLSQNGEAHGEVCYMPISSP